ncbi:MAG: hypothetical protein HYX68_08945 [Planctomycetes bacterium]|jgi:hypothetical protein|nr:hypothetical protein [Planctomycetota bacterium]
MTATSNFPFTTRPIPPEVLATVDQLQPGQRVRITQLVKVGSTRTWTLTVEGAFRRVSSLATGLATDRLRQDDIVIPVVHFTKDNQEMSSVAVDENTRIEIIRG